MAYRKKSEGSHVVSIAASMRCSCEDVTRATDHRRQSSTAQRERAAGSRHGSASSLPPPHFRPEQTGDERKSASPD